MVPATEVLAMIQRTLCFIGNASEQISQARRAKILEAIDPAWKKFSDDAFPSAKGTLSGEQFQSSLKDRVEKDSAISKAIAISKRSRKEPTPLTNTRREGRRPNRFFSRGPSWKVRSQAGQELFPVRHIYSKRTSNRLQPRRATVPNAEIWPKTPLPQAETPPRPQPYSTPTPQRKP